MLSLADCWGHGLIKLIQQGTGGVKVRGVNIIIQSDYSSHIVEISNQ